MTDHPSGPVHDAVHEWFKHHEDDYMLDAQDADDLAAYIIDRVGKYPLPADQVLARVQEILRRKRAAAFAALLTHQHVDTIAREVFSYVEGDEDRTPDVIAESIIRYVADSIVAPLALDGQL